jgi:hypothetical protein
MTTTNEGPGRAAGALTGPDCSLLGSENNPFIAQSQRLPQSKPAPAPEGGVP